MWLSIALIVIALLVGFAIGLSIPAAEKEKVAAEATAGERFVTQFPAEIENALLVKVNAILAKHLGPQHPARTAVAALKK
jgi:hypothetical protein